MNETFHQGERNSLLKPALGPQCTSWRSLGIPVRPEGTQVPRGATPSVLDASGRAPPSRHPHSAVGSPEGVGLLTHPKPDSPALERQGAASGQQGRQGGVL